MGAALIYKALLFKGLAATGSHYAVVKTAPALAKASKRLKADAAAQPKGCSVSFVLHTVRK